MQPPHPGQPGTPADISWWGWVGAVIWEPGRDNTKLPANKAGVGVSGWGALLLLWAQAALLSTLASSRSLTFDWLCSGRAIVCPRKSPSTFSLGGNPGPTGLL